MKKSIYKSENSELDIEFDGEYFLITQSVKGIDTQQISVTREEFSKMFDFVNFFFGD